jgi:hypothetical protein
LFYGGLSLKNRISGEMEKIMEKREGNRVALPFICKMRAKDYFTV